MLQFMKLKESGVAAADALHAGMPVLYAACSWLREIIAYVDPNTWSLNLPSAPHQSPQPLPSPDLTPHPSCAGPPQPREYP